MAGGIDWFRWHHGSVTDPKFQLIARKSGASLPDVLAVWAYLLEQASANEVRGEVGAIDCEAVDCMFGFPATETRTENILKAMEGRGMLADGRVTSWEKRQPKRERDTDNSAERTRAYRERQKQPKAHTESHVTPCDATERQKNAREEERREEEEKDTSSDNMVGAAVAARPEPNKASRLPDDWTLPKAWGEWAQAEFAHWSTDVVRLEGEKFADHWRTKSGKDARKVDWQAAWRNWCRSDIAQRSHPPARPGHQARASPQSFAERDRQARAAEMAKWAPGIAARPANTVTPTVTQIYPMTEVEAANVFALEGR